MFVVRGSWSSTPYNAQMVVLFWRVMMKLQRSRLPLDSRPLSVVLYPTNLKSTVVQYSGRGPGLERGRTVEQPKALRSLLDIPKGAAVVDRQ